MIYLIWGAPRSGKTTLAKMLAKRLHCSYIQTDYISSALSSKMSEEEEKLLFGEKSRDDNNRKDNETRFSVFSNEEQIEIYRKKALWNREGIRNMIDYWIADQETYIFEWYHLWPHLIHEDVIRRWNQIKYILLYKSNIEEIEKWIRANTHPNDRAIKNTHKESTYRKIASFLCDFWQVFYHESIKHQVTIHDTTWSTFKQHIERICNEILSP